MPHHSPTICPVDEIKVYRDEGSEEEAENLKEVKNSLVTEEEALFSNTSSGSKNFGLYFQKTVVPTKNEGKRFEYLSNPPFGYVVSSRPLGQLSMVNRVPLVPSSPPLSLMMYNTDFQPPPAHIGISPVHVDPKTGVRTPVYPLHPPSQFHPLVFSPDFRQQFPWPHHPMYSLSPPSFPTSSHFSNPTSRHPLLHHPLAEPKVANHSQNSRYLCNFSSRPFASFVHQNQNGRNSPANSQQNYNVEISPKEQRSRSEKKTSHIKKPLNAFMLFMKEQRSQVVAECTLKESAAINQLLGKKWHGLSRDEQSKYYELAKKERQVHMQMYPGWTARDNYAINAKKKKRKRDKSQEDANNPKKCRARYGLDRQSNWCKPCRRKKKCIRYISDNTGESEDNIDSVESIEAASDSCNEEASSSLPSPPLSSPQHKQHLSPPSTDSSSNAL